MKKFLILLTLGFSFAGMLPAQAIDLGIDAAKNAATNAGYDAANTTETTLAQNIGSLIRSILTISGVVFTGLVFYAGYLWMMARGDEGQSQKAKDIIEMATIGLIISLASYGITSFVMKNVVSRTTPTTVQATP